jgi:phytoene dehydrogenase-like protein
MTQKDDPTASLGKRAVVMGAGMGGMMAAEVLSRYFDEVLILEKDALPAEP